MISPHRSLLRENPQTKKSNGQSILEYIVHCCVTKYKIVLFDSFFLSFIFPFFFSICNVIVIFYRKTMNNLNKESVPSLSRLNHSSPKYTENRQVRRQSKIRRNFLQGESNLVLQQSLRRQIMRLIKAEQIRTKKYMYYIYDDLSVEDFITVSFSSSNKRKIFSFENSAVALYIF